MIAVRYCFYGTRSIFQAVSLTDNRVNFVCGREFQHSLEACAIPDTQAVYVRVAFDQVKYVQTYIDSAKIADDVNVPAAT